MDVEDNHATQTSELVLQDTVLLKYIYFNLYN